LPCGSILLGMDIGKRIEARAEELNIGATKLGQMIGTSKQNIYSIYKRSSVDTELLKKLGKALDFDFFGWLADNGDSGTSTPQAEYGIGKKEIAAMKEENDQLKWKLEHALQTLELVKALYESDTGKKVPGSEEK
jgi:hypothetical protein